MKVIDIPGDDNVISKDDFSGKCTQEGCKDDANHVVFWPGRGGGLPCCGTHTEKAKRVAKALGFELSVQKLTVIYLG